jgi:flagellin
VTLAAEAATGTVSDAQRTALDAEFTAIKDEITRIGTDATFNATSVFTASTTSVFLTDASSTSSITVTVGVLSASSINGSDLSGEDLTSAANAESAVTAINTAIANVAALRGTLGATINRLQAAANVIQNQVQNLSAAEDGIRAADIAQEVGNLSRFSILNQTGIAALAQANSQQQAVLALLR